MERIE
jgi:hypothetical protein